MKPESWNSEIRETPQESPVLGNSFVNSFPCNQYEQNNSRTVGGSVFYLVHLEVTQGVMRQKNMVMGLARARTNNDYAEDGQQQFTQLTSRVSLTTQSES
jgi:hypothetical protein